ncbi:MAG: hypothetical protein U5K33_05600 [Halofilum sp. (in: g-proteobacteria)]|nr:hypothetical protein [Halofilum sp. (in: g-proteobacteria)]
MANTRNKRILIRFMEAGYVLDGRFNDLQVVNCDRVSGDPCEKGGSLSVVFRATDCESGNTVAIKFFDPDRQGLESIYRMTLFARESELLERDLTNGRSLHVIQPIREIDLTDPDDEDTPSISCNYFVTEWLPEDINEYFLAQGRYGAIDKLTVFRDVVLSVFSMHRNGLFHRDLKPENFRFAGER